MSTNLTQLQEDTLRMVMERPKERPITGTAIALAIGLKPRSTGKDGADMRSIIHALRVKGYPICASGNGYWWPQDQGELSAFIVSFQGRITDQQTACDGLMKGMALVGKKAPSEVIPDKNVIVLFEDTAYSVPLSRVDHFIETHPGAYRPTS